MSSGSSSSSLICFPYELFNSSPFALSILGANLLSSMGYVFLKLPETTELDRYNRDRALPVILTALTTLLILILNSESHKTAQMVILTAYIVWIQAITIFFMCKVYQMHSILFARLGTVGQLDALA